MRWWDSIVVVCLCLHHVSAEIIGNDLQYSTKMNKRIREWMAAEKEFGKLDEKLKDQLGESWWDFKDFMTKQIGKHHSTNDCPIPPPEEAQMPDTCHGIGSLTESEYILHQAIDAYSEKFEPSETLHRFHNMAHMVFERTRKLLQDLSLLQSSEYDPKVLDKYGTMVTLYKRSFEDDDMIMNGTDIVTF